jgi:hypothetical protein
MGKYGSNNSQPQAEVECNDFDMGSPHGGTMTTTDAPVQDAGNWTSDSPATDDCCGETQSIGDTPAG